MSVPYYSDDLVTLYHGDNREVSEWLDADVLVTDPPYGIGHAKIKSSGRHPLSMAGEVESGRGASNRVLGAEHVALRDEVLGLWGQRPAIVFGHWRAPRPAGTQMRLIWDRMLTGLGGVAPWRPADEEIYIVSWPNPRGAGGAVSSVLRHRTLRGQARPDHPTPKPVPLLVDLVQYCPPGVIADPFAGSGATLLAARQLGRHVIGVEVDERYCELIADRLSTEQATLFSA